jgi:hypothetical protein
MYSYLDIWQLVYPDVEKAKLTQSLTRPHSALTRVGNYERYTRKNGQLEIKWKFTH